MKNQLMILFVSKVIRTRYSADEEAALKSNMG